MVAFLEKSTGSEGFHQVIDFLNRSHICYALTKKPDVYVSFIKQFWRSAEATTDDNGEVQLTATIDGHSMTITEASLRRHLKLDDHDGITSIPNSEIFEQLALMGYHTDSDKLTFQKGAFSPQWRFLIHTILHCLSLKKTAWEQFSSNIATDVICLATNRRFNFSSDEGSLKLIELTNLVTKLSKRIGVLEDDLKKAKLLYSTAITKLILRVKKLEFQVKTGKARKRARVVLFEDDTEVEDDSSKQGRKLSNVKKGNSEVSTAGATKGTASEVPVISTAEENISTAGRTVTYRRRSEEERTRKDKGKAIMTEPEPKKKSKKELEQERLSFAEAIRLQEQMDEEQRAQIARDEEIARQWNEEEEQRVMSEAKSTKKIDWNDPSVIRYHALKMKPKTVAQARRNMVKYLKNQGNYKISDFKGMSYNEIRPIFEKVWDFNQHIEPMEHGSEKMKSPKKIEEEDVDTQKEMKDVSKESGAKRKKVLPRKSTRGTVKRQKMEEETKKEDLKGYLDIVPREEFAEDVESLSTKYPIVDWKTCVLTENFMYYQIFRGDGSSKNYKVLSEMLEDFDRQDVMDLYRLVKERYSASRPEGYDLMLWGDLHTLFEPDEEDEIWKNQHEYNLISWRLCDFCGIHILLMQNGIAIHMLTEKKYPLSQEMITMMLNKRLEVDHESTQAYELLKFIRSQIPENSFEVLKILENSLEVLKVLENNLESMKLQENWSVDGLVPLSIKKSTSNAIFPRLLKNVTTKFNHSDRNVDCPPPTCQFQVFRSVCKLIGLLSVIRIDHQELKKVIWYVLHNSPELDTYRVKFKSQFLNKDMKEEFTGWFGPQICQCHIDKDPGVSASSELFALACGPTPTPISVNGVRFVVHSRDERRTTQNNGICLPALHIDGQSIDVDTPPDIINVDKDDDIIGDEDVLPHDLADMKTSSVLMMMMM
ncbi:hypothetical protein Tco_1383218 [Tanacetum coccineum]